MTRRALRALRFLVLAMLVAGPAYAQQTHVLVVTGVAGDEEHAQKFQKWAATFVDAAKKKEAIPDGNVTVLAEHAAKEGGPRATKEGVEKAFADIAARAKPNDELFVLLIGHGSFDGRTALFNLPGPDLSPADCAKLLAKFPTQRIVFVNTSSASGAFLQPLGGPNRVIVTATKTGGERNDTDFAEYFVASFADPAADLDHNGHVSINEAFEYARTKVTDAFKQKGLLLTEHAAMDDGSEGRLASSVFLGGGRTTNDAAATADMNDPAVRAIVEQRDAIQRDIAALQLKKASMDASQYDAQMEKLLTELALKTKALRDLQKK